ncbi:MAG TPA: FAD-dependent oxidoreductase [Terriglobales bacterium]|jgi:NADPH-dependent 2,4-dienoyl-CoA reductase/sulfur reductase-like enzyme/nitrite reductase/ring-hydroxylating ferredoxin subunit|nr:FAD-dependent oxidoreductase [Terriglobales bacterium]
MNDPRMPDLKQGISATSLPDDAKLLGVIDGEDVLLVRRGAEFFAVGAHCTHYHGPLADGLTVQDTVRCPWHHACFSLRTGEAVRAPALDPISCWRVERVGDMIFVREKITPPAPTPVPNAPSSVVIVGGGAAGLAAADMLRREGYSGPLTIVSSDDSPPVDRPNLSKDYLAGTAQEDWVPLRSSDYYRERNIDLLLNSRVSSLDTKRKQILLEDRRALEFGALLLATGADPVHLEIEGASDSQVHYLRTFADSKAIISKAASAKRVVVVGASFIGLEVAASLRARGIAVDVVAPDKQPLERVLGPELGLFIRKLHEAHGVRFHLGETVTRIKGRTVTLSSGTTVDTDFLVLGVGVRPSLALAEQAGLAIDRGIAVNEFLETTVRGIFAAGDAARWPDPHTGERIRVEHWVVAERQGQTAAKNMLGGRHQFNAVPFFWSQHYDVTINYVGHAEQWDAVQMDGSLDARDCAVTYKKDGRTRAVATISRDLQSLRAEAAMEAELPGASQKVA